MAASADGRTRWLERVLSPPDQRGGRGRTRNDLPCTTLGHQAPLSRPAQDRSGLALGPSSPWRRVKLLPLNSSRPFTIRHRSVRVRSSLACRSLMVVRLMRLPRGIPSTSNPSTAEAVRSIEVSSSVCSPYHDELGKQEMKHQVQSSDEIEYFGLINVLCHTLEVSSTKVGIIVVCQ